MKLRAWQQEALAKYVKSDDKVFFLQACPGAGKTKFTLTALRQEMEKRGKGKTFIIVVTPSDSLRNSWRNEAAEFGVQLTTRATDGTFPGGVNYQGAVITYHALGNYLPIVKRWQRQAGYKFILVCDEIHHTSESNSWGVDSLEYGELCDKVIFLSGTPNRTDRYKIPLAKYRDGLLVVDYSYGYKQALVDKVCREAEVRLIAFETASTLLSTGEVFEYDSESISESEESKVLRRALDTRLNLASEMIRASWEEIQKMRRKSGDRNAACLVRCLTSSKAGVEDGYISQVEKLIKKITGCTDNDIEVVHSGIDDSTERIARFRKSEKTFLISIRQVTEGVDIPRLRVLLHLDNTTADLTLSQELGRVTRWEHDHDVLQHAVIIMPNIPSYKDFAKRILDDVIEAAKEFEDIETKDQGEKGDNKEPFVTLYSEATTTSSVMSGETHNHEDALMKEALLLGSKRQCASMPTSSILNVLKAQQDSDQEEDCFSEKNLAEMNAYPFTQTKTNDEICQDLRRQINKIVNKVSALKTNGMETQKEVYKKLYDLYDLKTPEHFKGKPIQFIEMKHGVTGLERLLKITVAMLRSPK